MRKSLWLTVGITFLALQAALSLNAPQAAAATNLIANPSLQNGTTTPNKWIKNKWGQNSATFTYKKNDGHNSTRSAHVKVTNYISGDAKWYFNAVAAEPNTMYTFSDYYKANVKTRLVAVSYDANNTPTYFDVGSAVPASATTWEQAFVTITTLATTKKLSVFHIIERNGWLQIDTAKLTKDAPPAPVNWQTGSWGTNTPHYEYINEGHNDAHSVKLTMTNYQDGDAKWFFEPQNLEPGKDYRFSAWYKTNTAPNVVARFIKADGTEQYFGMPRPEPNSTANWQHYTDTFSVPADVEKVSVFFFLTGNGWLQTDDYSITPYQPTGFSRPLVSLTFDDGFEENASTVLPRLNNLGIPSTQCYATQFIEGIPSQAENVLAFKNNGHEICSHTVTHPALTSLPLQDLTHELTHSQQFLEATIGEDVPNFASPFGDYDAAVTTEIKKYYRSHRTVDEGYNTKDNFDRYRIRVQNMQATTTLAEFESWIHKAKADKTWLVLVYHRVTPQDPGQFDSLESDFIEQTTALAESDITIKTLDDALDELIPQL